MSDGSSTTPRRALYPGTFDPVTNGHISLIDRAGKLFDEVVVAVATAAGKSPLFTVEERLDLMRRSLVEKELDGRITVITFEGLLANLAIEQDVSAIIRGLRAVSDFEYEFQMALMNRKLARQVETVFLMPALSWVYLSSTIVKDVARNGGDVSDVVPECVAAALAKKTAARK